MDSGIGPYGFSDLRIPVPANTQLVYRLTYDGDVARRVALNQIPKFRIVLVLVVVLVLGALGFRDRKETDVLQLICSVSLIEKRSRSRGRRRARGRAQTSEFGIKLE